VVEWNIVEGVKTGVLLEEDNNSEKEQKKETNIPKPDLVRFDNQPVPQSVDQALQILEHLPALQDKEKRVLSYNFKMSPQVNNLTPQEFIERYGSELIYPRRQITLWQILSSLARKIFLSLFSRK